MFARIVRNLRVVINGEEVAITRVPAGSQVTVEVILEDELPERSPLHKQALNMDDLKVGLRIQRHNVRYGNYQDVAIIIGDPFLRGSKYGTGDSQAHAWMVPVTTTDYAGKLVMEDWYLGDMGVVPYERADGSMGNWNAQNYTLALA